MNQKTGKTDRRKKSAFVVAKANASTWVVAFSRRMIPGALFHSKDAALAYAKMLAQSAGLRSSPVVLGDA